VWVCLFLLLEELCKGDPISSSSSDLMYAFLLGDRSLMSNIAPSGPTRLGCRRCPPPPRFWPGVLVTTGSEGGGEGVEGGHE
jgi:hypothetical protein